jgi:predicted  nucleic acid-binding Zn-ribbon protein
MNTSDIVEIITPIVKVAKQNEQLRTELAAIKEKLEQADEEIRLLIDHIENVEEKTKAYASRLGEEYTSDMETMDFAEKYFELERRRGQAWPVEFAKQIAREWKDSQNN